MPAAAVDAPVVVVVDRLYDYHRRVIEGLAQVLDGAGVPLVVHVTSVFDDRPPQRLLRQVAGGTYRGVVTMALNSVEAQEALFAVVSAGRHDVPAVGIGPRLDGCPTVSSDNVHGMHDLMTHLLDEQGVRRLVLVRGVPHHLDTVEREAVVRQALSERGLTLDESLVLDGMFDRDPTYRAVAALRDRGGLAGVDAVVALNDISAFGALDVLDEEGLVVPDDVLVAGFDDHPASGHPDTDLTSVDQRLAEQGAAAGERLLRLLAGQEADDVRVPSRVVVRSSTGGARRPPQDVVRVRSGVDVGLDHTVLAMLRGFTAARTVPDVMRELAACLPRLGISRAFVVLHEGSTGDEPSASGRLALRFPAADPDPRDAAAFATDGLLPGHLRAELTRGTLVRHLLEVDHVEIGYVLTEQAALNGRSTELMRLELSRTLHGIARTQELARHADDLERLVDRRTRELQREVAVRRRAESELTALNAELRASLHLDGLTGIANRVAFDERVAALWAAAAAAREPLSLLLVDVDFFKAYNDSYGHLLGDEALRVVARSLREAADGPGQLGARYGGEEFAVLLPGTSPGEALVVADRVREVLGRRRVPHMASAVGPFLTVSVGAATTVPEVGDDPLVLVRSADVALYRAKRSGRDRVCAAEDVVTDLRRR